MELRCFGAFEVLQGSAPVRGLELRDADRLLAFLALRPNRLVPTIPIAEALWPETGSLDSLHQSTRQARLALGEEAGRLESRKGFLRLDLDGVRVDVVTFDQSLQRGTPEALESAISVHTAPLLELWEDGWVRAERESRIARYLKALKTLASTYRSQGDPAQAAAYLRLYLRTKRSEEWVWRELMTDLVQSGERYEALRLYERARETLFQKIAPPEEMTRLAREIQQPSANRESQVPETPGEGPDTSRTSPASQNARSYLPRPEDNRLSDALARFESVILLQGSAQSGKTLLLAKGLEQSRRSGIRVAQVDLRRFSLDEMATAEGFYQALAYHIAEQLGLGEPPAETWNPKRSPNANFEGYLRRSVLQHLDKPLVLGLDEVDRLFETAYGVDVFALFRAWHNARSLDPGGPWRALTLILAYSTEARLFITDMNQSPFNVGVRIALTDFTAAQVADLNAAFGHPLKTPEERTRFLGLVAGHPYLVHQGLCEMATQSLSLEVFSRLADRDDGPFGGHLRHMRGLLLRDEGLAGGVKELIAGASRLEEETFYRLLAAGIVSGDTQRDVRFRCPLYARYLEGRVP